MESSRMRPSPRLIGAVLMVGLAPAIAVAVAMAMMIGALSLLLSRMVFTLLAGTAGHLTVDAGDDRSSAPRPTAEKQVAGTEPAPTSEDVRRHLNRLVRHVRLSVRAAEVRDPAE